MMDEAEPICLMLAMPARGEVALETVQSLLALTREFHAHDVCHAFVSYDCADQTISRNHLTSRFLTETRFSHMLMIDSDMVFAPQAVWRLIGFGADFAAAAYAQKFYDWPRLRALFAAHPEAATSDILAGSLTFNHQIAGWGGTPWAPKRKDGFITVPAAGPGLALITRRVVESMVDCGVAAAYPDMARLPGHKNILWHDFWSHGPVARGGLFGHTDQAFSHRWVEGCGGDLWLDVETDVRHIGAHMFHGQYSHRLTEDFPDQ